VKAQVEGRGLGFLRHEIPCGTTICWRSETRREDTEMKPFERPLSWRNPWRHGGSEYRLRSSVNQVPKQNKKSMAMINSKHDIYIIYMYMRIVGMYISGAATGQGLR
jgi:hypothetical protein